MIKIEKLSDINLLGKVDPLLRDYIMHLIGYFCEQYDCSEISEFGAFYILESKDDVKNHSAFGLSCPISQTIFEYVDLVKIKDNSKEATFVSTLALLNNDYGVNIFVSPTLLSNEDNANLFEEYSLVQINISKKTSSLLGKI